MNTKKSQVPDIGAPFEGGLFGGQIRIGGAILAVIWAPKSLGETEGVWLPDSAIVPDALSYCDSMGNSYLGLLRQASHSHADRARMAKTLMRRGHAVSGDLERIFQKR